MNDYFYLGSTDVLTTKGFIPIKDLNSSTPVIYIDEGTIYTTKDFNLLKSDEVIRTLSVGGSNVVKGTADLKNKLSLFPKLKLEDRNSDYVTFLYGDHTYKVLPEVFLTYSFLFLNYFSYNSSENTFNFRSDDRSKIVNYTVDSALKILSTYTNRFCEGCCLPDDFNHIDYFSHCFLASSFPKDIQGFIRLLFSYQDRWAEFLGTMERATLIYRLKDNDTGYRYSNVFNKSLAKILLFILTTCGKNPISKKKYSQVDSKGYNLIYFRLECDVENTARLFKSCDFGEVYNLDLPTNGTLITSTCYNGFTTITYGPSLDIKS